MPVNTVGQQLGFFAGLAGSEAVGERVSAASIVTDHGAGLVESAP
ncbi:hypothetical protein AB0D57_16340 [Streptomyces sp. NPDC048275]